MLLRSTGSSVSRKRLRGPKGGSRLGRECVGPDLPAAGSVAGRAGWLARRRGLSEEEEVEEATLSEGGLA